MECVADEAQLAQRIASLREREDKCVAVVARLAQRIACVEHREYRCVADEAIIAKTRDRCAKKRKVIAEGSEPPNALLCPISLELMLDPVIDANGHTFERMNIEICLENRPGISPYTNAPYPKGKARLTTNFALLDVARRFVVEIIDLST